MIKILIIGNGQIGQAIYFLLNKNKTKKNIEIYDNDETRNESKKSLKECLVDVDFIFLCIPSWFLSETLKEINKNIKSNTILISLSKGINADTKETVNLMIEKNVKNIKYAMLSGPMFAKEIIKDKMSFAILASKDKKVFERVKELFKNTKLKLEYSKDLDAIALSGVLKNIYTLAISIIDCSIEDNNIKGFLSTKAVKEMQEIMKILKLDKNIILGTSGLGDFIATVSSEHSQNRKVGADISTKGHTNLKSEGLISLPPLISKIGKKYKKLPMLCLLEKIIIEKKDSKKEIEKFLKLI
jgi:glycerol-3-phosphate dehydrogenase (NAD(P)+)